MKYILIIITILFVISALIGWFMTRLDDNERNKRTDFQTEDTPSEIVDAFYESWLDADDPINSMAYDDSRYVTHAFVLQTDELLDRLQGGDYDPILCAADRPESYKVFTIKETPDTAEIAVRMEYPNKEKEIRVYLNNDLDKWKINTLVCPN